MKVKIMIEDIPEESVFTKESGRNSLCIEYLDVDYGSLIIEDNVVTNNAATVVPDSRVRICFDVHPTSGLDFNAKYTMIIPEENKR